MSTRERSIGLSGRLKKSLAPASMAVRMGATLESEEAANTAACGRRSIRSRSSASAATQRSVCCAIRLLHHRHLEVAEVTVAAHAVGGVGVAERRKHHVLEAARSDRPLAEDDLREA